MFEIVDLSTLGAKLLTISAVTKVLVDVMKVQIEKSKRASEIKIATSYIIPITIALVLGISIFEVENTIAYYIGCVLAGAIGGLGSTYIHEILKALQTLKSMKK